MSAHTPGPWIVGEDGDVIWGPEFRGHPVLVGNVPFSKEPRVVADAHLIAAAPDYHDAVHNIFLAVEANAAPINVIAALREVSLEDGQISLAPELLIALFEAHAKAKGESA